MLQERRGEQGEGAAPEEGSLGEGEEGEEDEASNPYNQIYQEGEEGEEGEEVGGEGAAVLRARSCDLLNRRLEVWRHEWATARSGLPVSAPPPSPPGLQDSLQGVSEQAGWCPLQMPLCVSTCLPLCPPPPAAPAGRPGWRGGAGVL